VDLDIPLQLALARLHAKGHKPKLALNNFHLFALCHCQLLLLLLLQLPLLLLLLLLLLQLQLRLLPWQASFLRCGRWKSSTLWSCSCASMAAVLFHSTVWFSSVLVVYPVFAEQKGMCLQGLVLEIARHKCWGNKIGWKYFMIS